MTNKPDVIILLTDEERAIPSYETAELREWRESYRRCAQIGDSAGMGAALGNIGAGYYQSGELDSADHYLTRTREIAEPILGRYSKHF